MASEKQFRIDFVCVENAGRSQMAAAFAERECAQRGICDQVSIHSGGTRPADAVHDDVIEAMTEVDIDISDRTPSYVVLDDLKDSHYLITMGCHISEFNPAQYGVESREWEFKDPGEVDLETVREIRDDIEERVGLLFDEIQSIETDAEPERASVTTRVRTTIRDVFF
jgi:protein-tyrosine-phosphatase